MKGLLPGHFPEGERPISQADHVAFAALPTTQRYINVLVIIVQARLYGNVIVSRAFITRFRNFLFRLVISQGGGSHFHFIFRPSCRNCCSATNRRGHGDPLPRQRTDFIFRRYSPRSGPAIKLFHVELITPFNSRLTPEVQ